MSNYTQFAVPGLMTPHAPNFKKNIIASEAGDIIMLLHSGVATDCVHYCLVVGGNRKEGVVKDPSYPFVNGMDGREMDKNKFNKAPDFAYKTTDLPDEVYIPKVNIKGCPIPITELNKAKDKTYFILKLPRTALPQGDTVIQVSINGRLRQYIVQRPTFFIHTKHKNISNSYVKLGDTPETKFNIEIEQAQDSTIEIDTNVKTENTTYSAQLIHPTYGDILVAVDWEEDGDKVYVTVPAGLPSGHYVLVVAYSTDGEEYFRLTKGYVEIKPTEVQVLEADTEIDSTVELEYSIPETTRTSQQIKVLCKNETEEQFPVEYGVTENGISFTTPSEPGVYTVIISISTLPDEYVDIINLTLNVQ